MAWVLFAGVPRSLIGRLKNALTAGGVELHGWDWAYIAGDDRPIAGISQNHLNDILTRAAELGGAHVLGFSEDRNRRYIEDTLRAHFRFRWFNEGIIRSLNDGTELFLAETVRVLQEEHQWREQVMPKDCSSPLILPGAQFRTNRQFSELWRLSETYNAPNNFVVAARLAQQFSMSYRKKVGDDKNRAWIDDGSIVWKDLGPFHGDAAFPRNWKYSLKLIEKFHFDVSHERQQKFSFRDAEGKMHLVKAGRLQYLNVDAHGYVR